MQGVELFRALCERLGLQAPAFPPAASPRAIAEFEQKIGHRLPASLASMYLIHDGEVLTPGEDSPCLFLNREFISLDRALADIDAFTSGSHGGDDRGPANWPIVSVPPGFVQDRYYKRDWIPFAGMYAPDVFAIDYVPGPNGTVGQVIHVDGDGNERTYIAPDFDTFLEMVMRAYDDRRLHERFGWDRDTLPDFLRWRRDAYGF